ncbi:PfkB family carbohydrate kinase [Paraconexibacter sp.]|uniref:PfkB family carbohydrate kinase n=1 Tax=Paraconexibacter sp. TaxID=2949640 RepID=UPI00356ABDF5
MYVAVGQLTIDRLPDGRRRAGGTVLFGGLAADLRGQDAHIVTAAAPDVEALLPDLPNLTIARADTPTTTEFVNRGTDRERVQELRDWAGMVPVGQVQPRTTVLHLGPVARELDPGWIAEAPAETVVVLTPQGLVREWPHATGGPVTHRLLDPAWSTAIDRPVVVILGAGELAWVGELGERAVAAGGALIVTDGHRPITVRTRGSAVEVTPRVVDLADDTGAGDVFAAAVGLALAEGLAPRDAVAEAALAVGDLLPRIQALLPTA